jgi:hypothetical protein
VAPDSLEFQSLFVTILKAAEMKPWLWAILIFLLSIYVVYEHATSPLAVDMQRQIERHERMIAGNSEFYNPWQYRIFSAWLLEAMIKVYHSVLPGKPEPIPYLALHFAQVALIFILCLMYFQKLGVKNPFLLGAGLIISSFCISTSVFQSDLSFNTYFDIIFYLTAALLILSEKIVWIIPLTVVAASNRETSGFIPLMVLTPFAFRSYGTDRRRLVVAASSLILFAIVFFFVRWYFGFRPAVGIHGMTSPIDFFIFNITFLRMYPLMLRPGINTRSGFRLVMGTDADQTAVGPGVLKRTWQEKGRRYFEYGLEGPVWPLVSIQSARFEVARDDWNGVALEIYHDPKHSLNVPKMLESAKKGLDYYSRQFGPYHLPYYRMAEYARYRRSVQAGVLPDNRGARQNWPHIGTGSRSQISGAPGIDDAFLVSGKKRMGQPFDSVVPR